MLDRAKELLIQKIKEICEVKSSLENGEIFPVEKAIEMLSELIQVYQTELHDIVRLEREKDSK